MSAHYFKLSVACFLLLGVALFFVSEGAEAVEPVWSDDIDSGVNYVSISEDGSKIIAGGDSDIAYFYNHNSSSPVWSYDTDSDIQSVDLSNYGSKAIIGINGGIIYFDTSSSSPDWTSTDGTYPVSMNYTGSKMIAEDYTYLSSSNEYVDDLGFNNLATSSLSSNGNHIVLAGGGCSAGGSSQPNVKFFDWGESSSEWSKTGYKNIADISADGSKVVTAFQCGSNTAVRLFDNEGDQLWSSIPINQHANTLKISEDGKYVIASFPNSGSHKVFVWDTSSSTPKYNFSIDFSTYINGISISENNEFFVLGGSLLSGSDGKMGYYRLNDGNHYWNYTFTTDGDYPRSVDISENGQRIVVGSNDENIYYFEYKAPEWSYDTDAHVKAIAVSADGEYTVAGTGQNDESVYLFDKDGSTPLWSYDQIGNDVSSVAISADGEYIVSNGMNGKFHLFDKDSSTPIWTYSSSSIGYAVDISADGNYIVASGWSQLFLFHRDSNTPLWSSSSADDGIKSISISANGENIVVGSLDDKIYFYNKDSNVPLWSYEADNDVSSVDISSDGNYITASSKDYKVYLFHKDSGTPLWSYDTGDPASSVSISSNGDYIVGGSVKAYLFHRNSSTPLWSYGSSGYESVSISADGEYIVLGHTGNSRVYLFNKDSNVPLWKTDAGYSAESISISSDGKYIAVAQAPDEDSLSVFINNRAQRPSLVVYGPSNGSSVDTDPLLGWFASSDDRDNLTFDVYLDTDSNPTTKVADDITTFYYNAQCLDINTKYYWKVVATDGDDTVTSSVMNFTVTSYGNIFCISIDDDYDPDTLTIKKGSTVIWTNDDNSLHTVTEDDDGFDSGSISPGNTWSYTFNTVGIYDYYDQYDDDLDGQIIVLVSYKPTATISSISPQIAELDSTVSFSGSGSDSDGTISEYKWTSSIDGDLSTSASFSTTDLSFGNHTITFRVKDNDGVWSDNVTSWVDVRKSPEWSYQTSGFVNSVSISSDGEYIAVGDQYMNIYLFDKDSSSPLWSYSTEESINSVSISADGNYIVAGSEDNTIYFFGKNTSNPIWSYETGGAVNSVSISSDGNYIVVGSEDNKIYLFNKDSSTPLWSYETDVDGFSVSISADGEYIVGAFYDGEVYLFNKDSSTPLWNYDVGDYAYGLSISADGEYIVASSYSGAVYLFNKDSGTPLWNYDVGNYVMSAAISADGKYITIGSHNHKVYLFDKDSNTPIWSYTTDKVVCTLSITANGEYIIAGVCSTGNDSDNKVHLFDKDSNTPIWNYTTGHWVSSVTISADGKYIAAGSDDKKVYAFKNNPVSRPSIIPYGPRSGSLTLNDTILGWFPGSDDIANLTFDVYLSFIYNDVATNNSAALIADDITNYTYLVTGLTESKKYYWKVVATDSSGSATSKIMNFSVSDSTAPVTEITNGPSNPTDYKNATFIFTADEDGVTFKCKLDTGNWSNCSSPKAYYSLEDDMTHQFRVKAIDSSGNEGEADTWIWTINDITAPNSTITSGPDSVTASQTVTFTFIADEDDVTFECRLDGGYWSSCTSPKEYDSLAEGSHTFHVRATDDSDNVGSAKSYSWQIDITAPVTTINSGPSNQTYTDSASFYFTSNEYNSTFDCRINSGYWFGCSSPENFYNLDIGNHTFYVKATDPVGNVGEYELWSWEILENDIPELVNYNVNPNPAFSDEIVNFYSNFSDSDGFITQYFWISSRDGFLSSSGNFSTDSLSIGNHLIMVRAKDNQGSWSNNYTVSQLSIHNRIPELVNYTVTPNPANYNDRVYFYSNFSDSDGYIVQYAWISSIDGLLSSNSNFSTDDLSAGNHTITVRAKDNYGGWSENASIVLEVEESYSPPVVNWIQISPNPGYYSDNILFTSDFSLCDDCYAIGFEWRSDVDGVLESQNSMFDYVGLTVGMHNFSFKVRDNTGTWSDTYNDTLVVMQDEDYFIPSVTWINIDSSPSYEGEMVFLEAIISVCDVTDCFITDYEWISDIDGLFETQSSDVYRVGFSLGEHNISLRVKDNRGAWSNYYNTTLVIIEDNPIIYGCTDSSADNFYPDAVSDDGSCVYTVYGCTNFDASNYNPNATVEDGSCSFGVLGCTSTYANNYNSEATSDDGSCEFDELENFTHTKLIDLYKLDASNEPYLHKSKGDSLAVEYFSSYYSTSEYTRNKGDWVYLPQWYVPMQYLRSSNESEQGLTDLRLSKISVKLWWMEELNDEDYDAALDFKFTVLQNEEIIYQMYYLEDLECDENQEASPDNPCLLTLDLVLPYVASFSEDDTLSLDIQMRSFQVIKILYGSEERDSGMSLYGIASIDDNDLIPEDGDMFYLPPEGQELIPKNLSVTYGIAVNSDIHQGIQTLANLSGVTLCLETGGEIDSYLANYFGQLGLDYIPLDSDELSGTGESFFVGGYCGAWVAKSDTLQMFDESYDSSFQREILMEKVSINYTTEHSVRINAQYSNTAGLFKSDRQPVNVGTWDYFSTVNDTIIINYAELWWQNLENGDDTCIWKFSIYKNGFSVDEYSADCKTDGTILLPEIYIINSSFAVLEGDHIQIEITYEGWEDIQFYYGSELHPSGFSISGLTETEVTIGEELEEDDIIDEVLDEGSETIDTPSEEVSLPFELNVFTMGLMAAAAGLVAAAFAEAGARQSVTKIIDELQSLVDAGVTDSDLNKSIEELQNLDGFRYFSGDRSNALELLNNYNEVQGQALGAMQQLDELESVVAELEAAGVSSPELDAEISDIQSMLEAQLEGDTSEDYSKSLFEQFRQNKGGD